MELVLVDKIKKRFCSKFVSSRKKVSFLGLYILARGNVQNETIVTNEDDSVKGVHFNIWASRGFE